MKTLQEWIEENKFDINELQQRKWDLDFQIMDAEAAEISLDGHRVELEVARDRRTTTVSHELKARIKEVELQRREQQGKALRLRAQRKRVAFALKTARREKETEAFQCQIEHGVITKLEAGLMLEVNERGNLEPVLDALGPVYNDLEK